MSVSFEKAQSDVLSHIESLLAEIEQEIALSHQEKYALLEDAFGGASDIDELKVAFDQWYLEHAEEIGFEHSSDELWDQALGGEHSFFMSDSDEEEEDDEDGEEGEKEDEDLEDEDEIQ